MSSRYAEPLLLFELIRYALEKSERDFALLTTQNLTVDSGKHADIQPPTCFFANGNSAEFWQL